MIDTMSIRDELAASLRGSLMQPGDALEQFMEAADALLASGLVDKPPTGDGCGGGTCAFHSEDRNNSHGGRPHIHYCEKHDPGLPVLVPLDADAVDAWFSANSISIPFYAIQQFCAAYGQPTAREQGIQEERARVVAWLRDEASKAPPDIDITLKVVADELAVYEQQEER